MGGMGHIDSDKANPVYIDSDKANPVYLVGAYYKTPGWNYPNMESV